LSLYNHSKILIYVIYFSKLFLTFLQLWGTLSDNLHTEASEMTEKIWVLYYESNKVKEEILGEIVKTHVKYSYNNKNKTF